MKVWGRVNMLTEGEALEVDSKLTRIVVLAVTGVWVVSFIADLFLPNYDPPAATSAAMMAIVGAATARYIYLRNGGGGNS